MTITQLIYPSLIRFCVAHEYIDAEAIPAAVEPDVERDLGACCWLSRRPRYKVAGVEQPFDPTIPDDLVASGWCWHGGFLTQAPRSPDGCALVIGSKPTLDAVWESARAIVAEQAAAAERTAEKARKAPKAPKARKAARVQLDEEAKKPAVVVVVQPPQVHQLALF